LLTTAGVERIWVNLTDGARLADHVGLFQRPLIKSPERK
jgi:hypothetical protein